MNSPLEWLAAALTIVAAGLIAANIGRRATGVAFILYTVAAAGWIVSALLNHTKPLAIQNGILLAIDVFGIWQYLLNPRKIREIDKLEEVASEIKEEVDEEIAAEGA
ncbi:MAG: hypothetical protein JF593_04275 [Novosphingobium sp.]|nr:hypothetical protein [Novosphingobium sp.]